MIVCSIYLLLLGGALRSLVSIYKCQCDLHVVCLIKGLLFRAEKLSTPICVLNGHFSGILREQDAEKKNPVDKVYFS